MKKGAAERSFPSWISRELLELTRKVWQPYYPAPLTETDLLEILTSAGQLCRILSPGISR